MVQKLGACYPSLLGWLVRMLPTLLHRWRCRKQEGKVRHWLWGSREGFWRNGLLHVLFRRLSITMHIFAVANQSNGSKHFVVVSHRGDAGKVFRRQNNTMSQSSKSYWWICEVLLDWLLIGLSPNCWCGCRVVALLPAWQDGRSGVFVMIGFSVLLYWKIKSYSFRNAIGVSARGWNCKNKNDPALGTTKTRLTTTTAWHDWVLMVGLGVGYGSRKARTTTVR